MEINKLIIIFDSYKEKEKIISNVILPYRFFFEGYYTTEIKEKNKLKGYMINILNQEKKMILASQEIFSNVQFNKYAVNMETLQNISQNLSSYISIPHKIILIELGSIYLLESSFSKKIIELLASDKKIIIFAKKSKEIESTMNKLYDALIVHLTQKESQNIKKIVDKFIGELVSRMEINE
ncbi:MAG: hypothetical protein N2Z20_03115 [Elusimicrobiales bacterium]|nr:hypothetical protein [Elusimicrobiales bacterium]